MDELHKQLDKLQKRVHDLEVKRIYQQDIIPQAVKNRHQGEANSYVVTGLDDDLPTTGVTINSFPSVSRYYAYDTKKLYIWNLDDEAWDFVQFT